LNVLQDRCKLDDLPSVLLPASMHGHQQQASINVVILRPQ
jgi:hypothetical protein